MSFGSLRELAITHVAELDGRARTVSENLVPGQDGRAVKAEVFHGISNP